MRKLIAIAVVVLMGACASSHEEGWIGTSARPFDNAQAACEIETQTLEGPQFERCMASKGWTRPEQH